MPCLLSVVALCAPRVMIFFVWVLTAYLDRAYHTKLWPLLGFFFMPYTTLAYAVAQNEGGGVHDYWIGLLILAVLLDAGLHDWARRSRSN